MACTHGRKICQILKSLSDRKAALFQKNLANIIGMNS